LPFTPHWLVNYGGTLGSGGEVWSNNVRMHSAADLDGDPDPDVALDAIQAATFKLFRDVNSKIGGVTKVTYLKFNKIGADGRYTSNTVSNTRFLDGTDAFQGASTSPILPYQCSLAVTWLTAYQRGRGSKGRIYPPGCCVTSNAEGHTDSTTMAGIANAYATFLNDLKDVNELPGDGLVPVVASAINGAVNPITRVSVGSVVDTMRKRRNALVEQRTSVAVA
jgi:hypothetical protein